MAALLQFNLFLLQIFAYGASEYKQIVDMYNNGKNHLDGPTSPSFAQFTVKKNEEGYGYTQAAGNICILSGDPALKETINAGKWYDEMYALTDSIFTPFMVSTSVNANETFKKIVVVGMELASLGSFAEYIRILIWSSIFKGAMFIKYNAGKGVAPCFQNTCPYDLDGIYTKSNVVGGDGLLSTIATPNIDVFNENIHLSSISLEATSVIENFSTFSNALQIKVVDDAGLNIPGLVKNYFY